MVSICGIESFLRLIGVRINLFSSKNAGPWSCQVIPGRSIMSKSWEAIPRRPKSTHVVLGRPRSCQVAPGSHVIPGPDEGWGQASRTNWMVTNKYTLKMNRYMVDNHSSHTYGMDDYIFLGSRGQGPSEFRRRCYALRAKMQKLNNIAFKISIQIENHALVCWPTRVH